MVVAPGRQLTWWQTAGAETPPRYCGAARAGKQFAATPDLPGLRVEGRTLLLLFGDESDD